MIADIELDHTYATRLRKTFCKPDWMPPQRFGNGWQVVYRYGSSVLVSVGLFEGEPWLHASIAHPHRDPTYDELTALHKAVFGKGYAYQCFVPPSSHVNIHAHALHLWGRLDGRKAMPDFGEGGSI